eukprot:249829-Chlamydomonas_euryale.AAC.1
MRPFCASAAESTGTADVLPPAALIWRALRLAAAAAPSASDALAAAAPVDELADPNHAFILPTSREPTEPLPSYPPWRSVVSWPTAGMPLLPLPLLPLLPPLSRPDEAGKPGPSARRGWNATRSPPPPSSSSLPAAAKPTRRRLLSVDGSGGAPTAGGHGGWLKPPPPPPPSWTSSISSGAVSLTTASGARGLDSSALVRTPPPARGAAPRLAWAVPPGRLAWAVPPGRLPAVSRLPAAYMA